MTNKTKLLSLVFGITMCLALMLGIVFASPTSTVYAEGGTPITELTISGLTDADVPQIGKKATLPTLTVNEGLTLSYGYGVYWFSLNTRKSMTDTDTFESGFTYALRVQYSVLDGYEGQITDPAKIKLDGVTTPYTVEIDQNAFINFIFDVLGNEELSLVNPAHLHIKDGYIGAHAGTDYICVKGGKFPYTIDTLNIQHPSWLTFVYNHDNGKFWRIQFYGTRPTTPTPSENFSFTITDADGTSKTFTGTTGETKENPDAIQNIVVNYNLPDVGATSPTEADLPSAITLPENVVCKGARLYKTDEYSSTTPFTFEKWGKYTLRLYLETTNGKLFAGDTLLKGYLVSNNNFSYSASFGNYTENSLVLDFNVTKYGVTIEELDTYKMTTETLKHAKKGVPYNEKIEFTKPAGVADSDIVIECSTTLFGLSVNADGTITGIPDERAYYNWGDTRTLKVIYLCKGYELDYKEYQLVIDGYTQISWPSGKTLKYNGNEQIGVEEGEGYTLSGTYKAKDIGEYTAIAKLNPGYRWGVPGSGQYGEYDEEITWKIVKGDQSAPTGITTEQATVEGKNDGKILGVTTDMTYSRYNEGSFRDCTGTTIENLASGKYEVRYKENANYNIGEPTVVEITNKYEKTDFKITTATLPNGKCDVEYNAKIDVTCPTEDLSKVEIYNEASYRVWGLNLAKDGTISGKPDSRYGNGQKNVEWRVVYYYDGILMEQKTYFLDIDGYSVIALFQGNQNLIYDGSEQIGVSEGEGYTLTGTTKATDAGSYKATAILNPGYRWDTTSTAIQFANHNINWSIAKANKDAPAGVKGFNTSNVGVSDGKITGVTTDMEYRAVGGSGTYADCTGAEITGLAKGQYEVRYKESKNYKASAHVTITIAEKEVITYTVTVTGGTGGGEFEEGASVTITANAPATGKKFSGWTIDGISGLDTTQTSLTFNMPANAVTATANYEDIEYTVAVNGGTADKAKAKYGETVTLTATVPTGKRFVEWTSESGSIFADKTSVTTTFTMPVEDVTVVATFEDESYRITVTNGTATPEMAKYQDEVTVTANAPGDDEYFDKWEVTGITLSDEDLAKSTLTFKMPAGNVTFKATYRNAENFVVTVTGGTGGGTYKQGESVTITANDPAEGKVFKCWKDASGAIVSTDKSYTFKVTGATTLTAVYGDKPSDGGEITPPAKKDGLSGGAIAGIVIGSVAVAGIGGFAIFWFAVRKKTFADLIAAIKGAFKNR